MDRPKGVPKHLWQHAQDRASRIYGKEDRRARYTGYERTFWRRHAADFVVGAIVCAIVLLFMWVGSWG